jgi:hypothetical protein
MRLGGILPEVRPLAALAALPRSAPGQQETEKQLESMKLPFKEQKSTGNCSKIQRTLTTRLQSHIPGHPRESALRVSKGTRAIQRHVKSRNLILCNNKIMHLAATNAQLTACAVEHLPQFVFTDSNSR